MRIYTVAYILLRDERSLNKSSAARDENKEQDIVLRSVYEKPRVMQQVKGLTKTKIDDRSLYKCTVRILIVED